MSNYLTGPLMNVIRRLADSIIKESNKPLQNAPKFSIIWGKVSAIPPTTAAGTADVYVSGDSVETTGINFLASVHPAVDDIVAMIKYGPDKLIIGSRSGDVTGTVIPVAYAILGPLRSGLMPGPFIPVPAGATVKIIKARAAVSTGTATITMKDNGTNIPYLISMAITTTPTDFTMDPYTWTDGHWLQADILSAEPGDLSLTLSVEYS